MQRGMKFKILPSRARTHVNTEDEVELPLGHIRIV